ncbi:TIGR02444 family protein [Halomonas cerina]|uniref:Uncharacterized protein (TIGR02444 family) n=1 Tax=Halomonas cerina TaxID=447424 RepID=A0A839VBX4_9GAMM|nr:TIGR02444 family protein [Halomonas cerina]MBB3190204.1 uncharacterized protein (TIGR02444 family) [Halomonas cerina]
MSDDSTEVPCPLRARLAAEPLWDFALAFYGREGVETACLTLQDQAGVDVCELLWRCWLYRHGLDVAIDPGEVRHWQASVTVPLRELRRHLKPQARQSEPVAELRCQLQQVELLAEREALSRLEALSLASTSLTRLPDPPPGLENHLVSRLQMKKNSHVIALQALKRQLDPPWGPR